MFLIACETDVDRIREANRAARENQEQPLTPRITPTPTIDLEATVIAIVTASASQDVEAMIAARVQATVESFSEPVPEHTPTGTPTSTPKPIATPLPSPEADISPFDLRVGDCFDGVSELEADEEFEITEVLLVPCDGPWQGRVVSSFLVERDGSYPASKVFSILALRNCKRIYTVPFIPSLDSWSLNDRTVSCVQMDFGIPHSDFDRLDNIINPLRVENGECFDLLDEGEAFEILSCTGEWQYRIVGMISLDSLNEFPGDEFINSEVIRSCDRRGSIYFPPTLDSWEDFDDRLIYCAQEGQGLAGYSQERIDRIVDISKLNAGECFNEDDQYAIPLVEIVPCDGPWQSKLLNSFVVDIEGPYPGESYFETQAFDRCDRLYDFYLIPLPEQWDAGHKEIQCIQLR